MASTQNFEFFYTFWTCHGIQQQSFQDQPDPATGTDVLGVVAKGLGEFTSLANLIFLELSSHLDFL